MPRRKCTHYQACSAPLCPDDPESMQYGLFYADEEICRRQTVPDWVRRQRKLAKVATIEDGYFTVAMLNRNVRVCRGIKGLNPDSYAAREDDERRWIDAHPGMAPLSEEERERRAALARENFGSTSRLEA